MTDQERALWSAVYQLAIAGSEPGDARDLATQAVRDMRATDDTLHAEQLAAEARRKGAWEVSTLDADGKRHERLVFLKEQP